MSGRRAEAKAAANARSAPAAASRRRILLLAADDGDGDFIRHVAEELPDVELLHSTEVGASVGGNSSFDCLVCCPSGSGGATTRLAAVRHARLARPSLPLVVLGEASDLPLLGAFFRLGAQEFLLKAELHPDALSRSIRCAAERMLCVEINQAATEQAQAAVRRRDHFLATLSHEIRNPLSAIQNAAIVLSRGGGDCQIRQNALDVIGRQTQQMASLLDDLLDVSKIRHDKVRLQIANVAVGDVVQYAVESAEPLLREREHRLAVELPEAPLFVKADPGRLRQILVNLLTNAAKYTPPGGNISIRARPDGEEAVLAVTDDGRGLSPAECDSIFDPFVQFEKGCGEGGLGIGLTLVRSLVELQRGSVAAASDGPDRGSTFTVRLPLGRRRHVPETGAVEEAAGGGLEVLVVEDLDDNRVMLQSLLELEGYEVRTCKNGVEALAEFDRRRPDVALIDIGLPGMTGYEIARRLRKNPGNDDVRLFALTGYGRPADRRKTAQAGFDAHLVKPLDPDELTRLLAEE